MAVWSCRCRVGVIVGTENGSKGFWGRIMKVFCLLANTVLARIGQSALNAPLARSLISCEEDVSPKSLFLDARL